ncbi:hypothetical protein GLAREA_06935 [Glarea lozoyensis ATCC 20868]|uniref:Uncharacterized protein n=2 Tax=Glarea lozoyensis TaxID=101852 RepID=S3D633_GLAL2|nr:uncharacterized protein GLAREA_06935 [Glarea lozoyensis ATCC 20868]EHK99574.1 hypothetical protein M7I_4541 [Glarea lozoyensis 74030]EPE33922.1 hypothetical protein GLAREA_06935 [Glarea lozoyensis ATCC 20868]
MSSSSGIVVPPSRSPSASKIAKTTLERFPPKYALSYQKKITYRHFERRQKSCAPFREPLPRRFSTDYKRRFGSIKHDYDWMAVRLDHKVSKKIRRPKMRFCFENLMRQKWSFVDYASMVDDLNKPLAVGLQVKEALFIQTAMKKFEVHLASNLKKSTTVGLDGIETLKGNDKVERRDREDFVRLIESVKGYDAQYYWKDKVKVGKQMGQPLEDQTDFDVVAYSKKLQDPNQLKLTVDMLHLKEHKDWKLQSKVVRDEAEFVQKHGSDFNYDSDQDFDQIPDADTEDEDESEDEYDGSEDEYSQGDGEENESEDECSEDGDEED